VAGDAPVLTAIKDRTSRPPYNRLMTRSHMSAIRFSTAFVAISLASALVSAVVITAVLPGATPYPTASQRVAAVPTVGVTPTGYLVPGTLSASPTPRPTLQATAALTIPPINVFLTPSPGPKTGIGSDLDWADPGRPLRCSLSNG